MVLEGFDGRGLRGQSPPSVPLTGETCILLCKMYDIFFGGVMSFSCMEGEIHGGSGASERISSVIHEYTIIP